MKLKIIYKVRDESI